MSFSDHLSVVSPSVHISHVYFLSGSTEPNLTELGTMHSYRKRYQSYRNKDHTSVQNGNHCETVKFWWVSKKRITTQEMPIFKSKRVYMYIVTILFYFNRELRTITEA